jgi:hypothetical protein
VELEVESWGKNAADSEDIHVGSEDEIVLEICTEIRIAAGGVDVELPGSSGVDGEVESHGKADGVEARTEIGRGRWEADVQGLALG